MSDSLASESFAPETESAVPERPASNSVPSNAEIPRNRAQIGEKASNVVAATVADADVADADVTEEHRVDVKTKKGTCTLVLHINFNC